MKQFSLKICQSSSVSFITLLLEPHSQNISQQTWKSRISNTTNNLRLTFCLPMKTLEKPGANPKLDSLETESESLC